VLVIAQTCNGAVAARFCSNGNHGCLIRSILHVFLVSSTDVAVGWLGTRERDVDELLQ
jgi:hypothetical protein